ncbi:hypothetical protein SAMN04488071_2088 [Kordiimonas lacus]|uniref:Uncharacterized protein n=2 Tax=Kordiimonas lacus TaxID=637679 RepID=A0A1G7A5B4_9PROT|nr:hypothetical protein SAMN04488071_2088 [Kordiimonas lacus]
MTMNAPLVSMQRGLGHDLASEYKEELLGVVLHASAALEAPAPSGSLPDAFQKRYSEAKTAAYRFVNQVLDPLLEVPMYLKRQQQIICKNPVGVRNCFTLLRDSAAAADARKQATDFLKVQADTAYFSLNSSAGKVLTLEASIRDYADKMTQPVQKLKKLAGEIRTQTARKVDLAQLHAFEGQRQHLAMQLRAASWQLIENGVRTGDRFRVAHAEISKEMPWNKVPFVSVVAQVGEDTIRMDGKLLQKSAARALALHNSLCEAAKTVFHAGATADALAGLMMHAQDVLAQRKAICEALLIVAAEIERATTHCTQAQKALEADDYAGAEAAFENMAEAWHEAVLTAQGMEVDIAYANGDFVSVGMEGKQLGAKLAEVTPAHGLASEIC